MAAGGRVTVDAAVGWGMEAQVFQVVTFVNPLIYRKVNHQRRRMLFKMGQAGNGEKP